MDEMRVWKYVPGEIWRKGEKQECHLLPLSRIEYLNEYYRSIEAKWRRDVIEYERPPEQHAQCVLKRKSDETPEE